MWVILKSSCQKKDCVSITNGFQLCDLNSEGGSDNI